MRTAAMTARLGAACVLALALGACAMVGGSGGGPRPDEGPDAAVPSEVQGETLRSYGGSVTFDGSRIPLTLDLVGDEREFSARLSIPSLDLDAGGSGTAQGDELAVHLSYEGACPGRLELVGRFRDGVRRVEGDLLAVDCTGEEQGAVVLLLRPAG